MTESVFKEILFRYKLTVSRAGSHCNIGDFDADFDVHPVICNIRQLHDVLIPRRKGAPIPNTSMLAATATSV
jgi:hypothetical protein